MSSSTFYFPLGLFPELVLLSKGQVADLAAALAADILHIGEPIEKAPVGPAQLRLRIDADAPPDVDQREKEVAELTGLLPPG